MSLSTTAPAFSTASRTKAIHGFVVLAVGIICLCSHSSAASRLFTLKDDIELLHFGDPYTLSVAPLLFSPNNKFFIVVTERGLQDQNQVQSTVRVFSAKDVHDFVAQQNSGRIPLPIWSLSKEHTEGPVITDVHWLPDSSAFAFLAKDRMGNRRLWLAKLKSESLSMLTPANRNVMAYDIRRPTAYVFALQSVEFRGAVAAERRASAIVGTHRTLESLIFPVDLYPSMSQWYDLSELWAVLNGRRFRVSEKPSGQVLSLHQAGLDALALSPNGRFVVSARAFDVVPPEWETLYPAPPFLSAFRVRPGRQPIEAFDGRHYLSEYILIDLSSGKIKPLTGAPIGSLWGATKTTWSSDSQLLVLSNSFLPAISSTYSPKQANAPCLTEINVQTSTSTCIERLSGTEWGSRFIKDIHFVPNSNDHVVVTFFSNETINYAKTTTGSWIAADATHTRPSDQYPFDVVVKESFDSPPRLIGTDTRTGRSRIIWDPNPQLNKVNLADVSIFKWKDKTGRDWTGGLYVPPGRVRGLRYPLIIQTHGFMESLFLPSGLFPTAFAAQELAAAGFVVLQVRDCQYRSPAEEGPCNVTGYEAAVENLAADGLVDPNRVGIIGFSRTCYYVLEALTTSTLHFRAASITDGVDEGYLQYITTVDDSDNDIAHDADAVIGARPLKDGLQQWLKTSPVFNMDKVVTPVQIVALGPASTLFMWEPYALLRYLNYPVDLIVLNSHEHILSNPAARLISQGGTVDWFRFWLKDEEDPDPAKAQQYERWRVLRKLQHENEKESPTRRPAISH